MQWTYLNRCFWHTHGINVGSLTKKVQSKDKMKTLGNFQLTSLIQRLYAPVSDEELKKISDKLNVTMTTDV